MGVKPNNTSIVIYYSKDGKELRFPTGVKISPEKYKNGNFSDWDYKANRVKPSVDGYEEMNAKIEKLEAKANGKLKSFFDKDVSITPDELKQFLLSEDEKSIASKNSLILDLYSEFHEVKKDKFTATGTIDSLKDFTSTLNLIKDYETLKETKYKIYQFDKDWFRGLLNFMRLPHINSLSENKIYKTDGSLNPKTCKKRFDVIIQFAEYLREKKMLELEVIDELKKFRRIEIKVPKLTKVTLTLDEVFALYDFEFTDEVLVQIRDTFVFICLTGLRYGDYLAFDSKFIKVSKKNGHKVYERIAKKTKGTSGLAYKIPMCKIALDILAKYDNKLPKVPHYNERIKDALAETKLFDEPTQIVDKKTNEEKLRYECISMHKGRDTFITNLVDVTPLNQLMKYTGHSKLSTLQGYVDSSRDVDSEPLITTFNRKTNG